MAASFQFELDPVLQMRERSGEAAREALGRAVRARRLAEAEAARAQAALKPLAAEALPPTARSFRVAAAYRDERVRAEAEARARVARCQADEDRARRALAEAVLEHEALDGLRSEAATDHRVHRMRTETALLDDLATAGRARHSFPAHR